MNTLTARATTYNGIKMRSRLEATVAACWDRHLMSWEYEPRAFATKRGQYLPDFAVDRLWNVIHPTYVEVKGEITDLSAVTQRMDIILESEPQASLLILEAATNEVLFRIGRVGSWRPVKIAVCAECKSLGIAVPMRDHLFYICAGPCGAADVPLAFINPTQHLS